MLCNVLLCSRRRTLHALFRSSAHRCYSAPAPSDSPSTTSSSSSSSSSPTSPTSSRASPSEPILHIPKANIYGQGASATAVPVLHDVAWTIQPREAWAVLSTGHGANRRSLFKALFGQLRIHPAPPDGVFPFLGQRDSSKHVRFVSFGRALGGGQFFDYTARYGAVRDEDRRTLRETYFPELARPVHKLALPEIRQHQQPQRPSAHDLKKQRRFEKLADSLRLTELLDLPVISLSNGQTRRARIAQALLQEPDVLILEEPLTGLDVSTRPSMLELLHSVHTGRSPISTHVILGMRVQDPLPKWITHVAIVTDSRTVLTGTKEELAPEISKHKQRILGAPRIDKNGQRKLGHELVRMTGLNIKYGEKYVLKGVNWTIHENSRWHLMGENGAGKTTLLALLTGEHPQSFSQSDRLWLFGRHRASWPTASLNARIGRASPELHNAFPRRQGMTVWDVVGTGFNGNFVPRGRLRVGINLEDGTDLQEGDAQERWRVHRMWQVLAGLGPRAWADQDTDGKLIAEEDKEFAKRPFIDLGPGEQSVVLLMRALVGRPPLVLLDEVWAGMDDAMVRAARRHLADNANGLLKNQACVVISHWEEEVPWTRGDGVKKLLLKDGEGHQVD